MRKVKKKLIEVSTYPLILLGFLVLIMLGLRNYLLPQMDAQNIGTQLINSFPNSFGLRSGTGDLLLTRLSLLSKVQARSRFLEPWLIYLSERHDSSLFDSLLCQRMGQSDWARIGVVSDFSMMQEQKSQLFKKVEGT